MKLCQEVISVALHKDLEQEKNAGLARSIFKNTPANTSKAD